MIIIIKYKIYDISILYGWLSDLTISRMVKDYDPMVQYNMYFIIIKVFSVDSMRTVFYNVI